MRGVSPRRGGSGKAAGFRAWGRLPPLHLKLTLSVEVAVAVAVVFAVAVAVAVEVLINILI